MVGFDKHLLQFGQFNRLYDLKIETRFQCRFAVFIAITG
jgi:hypothetical protein